MKTNLKRITLICMLIMCFVLAACGSPTTLEEYLDNHPEEMEEINSGIGAEDGLSIDISGNCVTYSFDISVIDGATEELAMSDGMKQAYNDELEAAKDTFIGLCNTLESELDITGVSVVVEYCYGDNVIASREFTAAG